MDDWLQLLKNVNRGFHKGASQEEADAYVAERSNGQFANVAALQQHLNQQELTNATRPSTGEGLARSAAQGLSFGFHDEMAGALDALLGGDYKATRNAERLADRTFSDEHPWAAGGARLVGAIPSAIATAGLTAAPGVATAGQLIRQGAAVGAGAGALTGAGEADELSDIPRDATIGAGVGAGAGAVIGAVTKPLTKAASAIWRGGRALFTPKADGKASALDFLAREFPDDAGARLAGMEAARPGLVRAADVAPEMLDVAASAKGAIKRDALDFLEQRNLNAGSRMADEFMESVGGPGAQQPNAIAAARALDDAKVPYRAATYEPLEQVYNNITPASPNPNTIKVFEALTDPDIAGVYAKVRPMGGGQATNFRELQATLRSLRASETEAYSKGGQLGRLSAKEWGDKANALEQAMESAMPGFRAANAGWRMTKEAAEGFDLGAKALNKTPQQIADELASLSEEGRNAYRMALVDDYATTLRGTHEANDAARVATRRGNQDLEPRLRAAFPKDSDLDTFLNGAEVEATFRRTQNALQGSKTAPRTQLARSMFGGTDERLPTRWWHMFENLAADGRKERIAGEVGNRLLKQDWRSVVGEIDATRAGILRNLERTSTGVRGLSALAGGSLDRLFGE